jgi:hypothetical protein
LPVYPEAISGIGFTCHRFWSRDGTQLDNHKQPHRACSML